MRLGGGPPGQPLTASWPALVALACVLLLYGLFDGIATYRVYAHGAHGMGVVTRVHDQTTLLQVEGHVCAVSGEQGHVGSMVPVAYPSGRPGSCVVRRMSSFRWPFGTLLAGAAILAGVFFWRRTTLAPKTETP